MHQWFEIIAGIPIVTTCHILNEIIKEATCANNGFASVFEIIRQHPEISADKSYQTNQKN
jgi:hypothetical protein